MRRILWAIIKKDIKSILSSWKVWFPMVVLPIMLVVIVPSLLFFQLSHQGTKDIKGMDEMLRAIPVQYMLTTQLQKVAFVFSNYFFPTLFLFIPMLSSTIIAANTFAGEKERKTLETLLYAPVRLENLFFAKIIGVFVPAYFVTIISFVCSVLVNYYWLSHILPDFPIPYFRWFIHMGILCPSLVILGITFSVWTSARASTSQEAQQLSGLVVLPVLGIFMAQGTGLFIMETGPMILIAGLIILLDIFLVLFVSRSFSYESLLK
ncbi:MAG: ABC transporter permease subunit [Candidatus Riflebacteria bacterium]|nr:ABC transporter permease subunit [Candidatus Riflebacteria bacterium]